MDELARAEIVAPEEIPAEVIIMNSRAELLALDTG
jgi:transcription elongation GreA/GreB family factor